MPLQHWPGPFLHSVVKVTPLLRDWVSVIFIGINIADYPGNRVPILRAIYYVVGTTQHKQKISEAELGGDRSKTSRFATLKR